jgi:hypothetical protein
MIGRGGGHGGGAYGGHGHVTVGPNRGHHGPHGGHSLVPGQDHDSHVGHYGGERRQGFRNHEFQRGFRGDREESLDPPTLSLDECTYGDPVAMTSELAALGQYALETSGTYPALEHFGDRLYRFSVRDGVLVAQICAEYGYSYGLGDPPPQVEPAGEPLFDELKNMAKQTVQQVMEIPGEALRAASREFDREIASVKKSNGVDGVPEMPTSSGPQPTGTELKSIATPDYLRENVRSLY